ncbi:unnamed protein product [Callosobruchus maculatus]|uniref:Uncharacterized protein n=1 Tax=Callosobruchus maculatus TaxID=64391 RepID=A0A653CWB8_CALMS|nr:unnamed protein product [Callosobruchus maculatus]
MKNSSYKNVFLKAKLWENIGTEISKTGDEARKSYDWSSCKEI